MPSREKEVEEARKRINDHKWKELEKRGITRPKNEEERLQRIKDSHGGQ